MVYTIGSGAAPTSAPIGSGAVPSSSSVPIGSGASPNFSFSPPSYNPPRTNNSASSNNHRSASRSVHIDVDHHHNSCHDHDDYNKCDFFCDPSVPIACKVSVFILLIVGGIVVLLIDTYGRRS